MRRKERDSATTAYRYRLEPEGPHWCDVRILTDRGQVLDFTVVYLAGVEGRTMPILRYDAAHGYPHRDTLDWSGHVIDKQWYPLESLAEVLDKAILDVKQNYGNTLTTSSGGGRSDERN